MMRITILYGAVREGRQSIRAARAVEKALRDTGKADVQLIDIKQYNLPVMESRLFEMEQPLDGLMQISEALSMADGILFVSPEYNNSYSGALKNTVDYFTKEWAKKPIGVVAASNGKMGGINASNLMQLLVLAIGAFPMPYKLLVPELPENIDEAGHPKTEIMKKNLDKFVQEFLWFTDAIKSKKEKS